MIACVQNATVATMTAAETLTARTFPGDELADCVDAARVQHMFRLNPASACGANTEAHLSRQRIGAMAVTVDRDRHPSGNGSAREGTVHIEMTRRTVHFHRSTRI